MNTMTLTQTRGLTLKQLLGIDALTCAGFGTLLVVASGALAGLLGLPASLLLYAGLALFPCAALMFAAARSLSKPLVAIVIGGNFAWAVASVVVAFSFDVTTLGFVFVLAQAVFVGLLGALELRATRR